jgi:hypothetical protein
VKTADRTYFVLLFVAAVLLLLSGLLGCQRIPPATPGGSSSTRLGGVTDQAARSAGGSQTSATLAQSSDPAAVSQQTVERQEALQEAAPLPSVRVTETPTPAGIVRVTEQFGPPTILTHTVAEKTATTLGTAHRDESRAITARLASFRPMQFVGVAFLALALVSLHPVARAVIGGGKTIPTLAAALGLVLIFGPSLFVGRETLVLCLAVAGLGVAYLLVRLSHKEGLVDAARSSASVSAPRPRR